MKKLKVLSTKTLAPEALALARPGIEITATEMISITPKTDDQTCSKAFSFFRIPAAAFTSIHAVKAVETMMAKQNATSPKWKVFAIKGRTAEAASQLFSEEAIAATAENGSELASRILETGEKEIVLFCGNLRRPELPDILRENGVEVNELVVYENRPSPISMEDDFDAVLFFSPSTAEAFFSVNGLKPETVCFAIGNTTASALSGYTQNTVVISTGTSQEQMIQTVNSYFREPEFPAKQNT
jgi:uroporphyrinogen-III synthase